jgi:RNA polymerase sigma factor (sigma-70 family)
MDSHDGKTHFGRLLDRIRAGDPAARDQLIADAYERVHELAHLILKGRPPETRRGVETDDVVIESLEKFRRKLCEGLGHVPDNSSELFAYVAQIVRRVVIDHVRKRAGREFQTQFPAAELAPDHPDHRAGPLGVDVLERLALHEAVARLPERERRLLDWRYVWGMNDDEIAREEDCNPRTVRRRIRETLMSLRATLDPPNGEETP